MHHLSPCALPIHAEGLFISGSRDYDSLFSLHLRARLASYMSKHVLDRSDIRLT
ncbi:hypothetical protein ASZ90_013908 [hydrocarbon metagenome]|uniref:Uncharacterized protein n=1 Tax=hydrocarbon metagenome TaxID=938273 RepID=A0A0W8F6C4_9ZZZZ